MKIEVGELGELVLKEVYEPIHLTTQEGNVVAVCARDDTFEICVFSKAGEEFKAAWHRVNMQTSEIEPMGSQGEPNNGSD